LAVSYNEYLADRAASHAIQLLRLGAGARSEVLGFLAKLEIQLEDELRLSRLGDKVQSFGREARIERLLAQVRQLTSTAYDEMTVANERVAQGIAQLESTYAVKGFKDAAVFAAISTSTLTMQQIRSLASNLLIERSPARQWWARQAGDLAQRFADQIRTGVALGETTDDLVRRIRGRATGRRHTYELNGREHVFVEFSGGIMDTSTRHAEALVRTSVQTIAGDARRQTFVENQDVVKGIVQISTLDTRTTVVCLAYGGKAWSLPDYQPIGHDLPYGEGTPRHFGCRSTEAPLLRSWQELGIDLQDAPRGVRWSRLDGNVPGDFTMDDFLARRSFAQLEDILGPGRAQLYRDGKITLDDLLDLTGRPLTVAELWERYGAAA
jgi:hypothetical protein